MDLSSVTVTIETRGPEKSLYASGAGVEDVYLGTPTVHRCGDCGRRHVGLVKRERWAEQ